jgi:hypothetical protein
LYAFPIVGKSPFFDLGLVLWIVAPIALVGRRNVEGHFSSKLVSGFTLGVRVGTLFIFALALLLLYAFPAIGVWLLGKLVGADYVAQVNGPHGAVAARCGTSGEWCSGPGSNQRQADFQFSAYNNIQSSPKIHRCRITKAWRTSGVTNKLEKLGARLPSGN